jgi:hypothetical protein
VEEGLATQQLDTVTALFWQTHTKRCNSPMLMKIVKRKIMEKVMKRMRKVNKKMTRN